MDYLLEPSYEFFDADSESFLSLSVIEDASFVKLPLPVEPLDKKLITVYFFVIEDFKEGGGILPQVWVLNHEEQNDCLEKVSHSYFPILFD